MDEQERKRIKENQDYINQYIDGVEFEVWSGDTNGYSQSAGWRDVKDISEFAVNDKDVLRIKQTKPSIDWSHVDDEYIFMATHANGYSQIFMGKPFIKEGNAFWSSNMTTIAARCFSSYKPGTCGWRDSLVKRPDDV